MITLAWVVGLLVVLALVVAIIMGISGWVESLSTSWCQTLIIIAVIILFAGSFRINR